MAVTDFVTSEKAKWIEAFGADFPALAHNHQLAPERANSGADWTTWLILGGRGAGKTRAGAEWMRGIAKADPKARIALVGETEHDVRAVMGARPENLHAKLKVANAAMRIFGVIKP